VTEQRIHRWLSQFDLPDLDLAARVLDCVDFIPNEQIRTAFKNALDSFPGWNKVARKRKGEWRFAAFSSSAGESGDVMLQKFRHANNLASSAYDSLFAHRSELLKSNLGSGDHIVFVDDFSGTGSQIVKAWPEMAEYLPEGPDIHLVLLGASRKALDNISDNTGLQVNVDIILEDSDAVFDDACTRFTDADKATLSKYCKRTGKKSSAEFAEDGFVIVFAHTCPNNTLPILHSTGSDWEGLFRRYD